MAIIVRVPVKNLDGYPAARFEILHL